MRNKTVKTVLFILFVIYCAALAFVLFFPNLHRYSHGSRLYNIIPFATVSELIGRLIEGTINADIVVRNIGVNILLFVPMGAFLPVLFKKLRKFRWVILVCFSATVAAELIRDAGKYREIIRETRSERLYNIGKSAKLSAVYIIRSLKGQI